ncbi:MAG: alpha/beta hydrolase [Chloroflexi bacterium]|nr:alpha/beta hydrolase [Chloroflexota bacterium]MBM3173184.1 alpha/beta hydrolase [Chloroflexota bacterium]MBM3175380.1 alpha/beta hydrolase [Chloroflexota bacterium]MBM4450391.1 alpha/beta hydrolase [Chloroflexota bacterium]
MKKKRTILASVALTLTLVLSLSCLAPRTLAPANQTPAQGPAPEKLGTIERDVTYGTVDDIALKMDIYYPRLATGPVPAVLHVHGGGWTKGDKALTAGALFLPQLIKRGYLVASINYRLAPQYKFPAQIQDVKCAVRYLRAHAANYGIDPERIGAFGGSAGGHLVALLGLTDENAGFDNCGGWYDQSSRVQAVANQFGPSDLTTIFEGAKPTLLTQVFGNPDRHSDIVVRSSPVTYVSPDDPPFLIMHGDKDKLVPLSQSQILYDRLKAAGVTATLVIVKNAGHGLLPAGGIPSLTPTQLAKILADFFDQHLK